MSNSPKVLPLIVLAERSWIGASLGGAESHGHQPLEFGSIDDGKPQVVLNNEFHGCMGNDLLVYGDLSIAVQLESYQT